MRVAIHGWASKFTSAGGRYCGSMRLMAHKAVRPIAATKLDHICVASSDVSKSIEWYKSVLGFQHVHKNDEHFWPKCLDSPAFLQCGLAVVALLPIDPNSSPQLHNRVQFGEHFALQVSREEFSPAEEDLPTLLRANAEDKICQEIIEKADYGHQLSIFFYDLDRNVVELTTRVSPADTGRLGSR